MKQKLIFSNDVVLQIDEIVNQLNPSRIFVLDDENTHSLVLPTLSESTAINQASAITIKAGDAHKNIESLSYIWKQLSDNGATRHSLLINIGGGVVTDMGAFAAATFKRGISCVNIPTTLLAAVDASVGGKTGINFNGYKNEIGAFSDAHAVIISTTLFNTLAANELKSGYAEMLKHGLISGHQHFNELLRNEIGNIDKDTLLELLEQSVKVKADIVEIDPTERGIRRALNLGHTIGHAFESLALYRKSPIPHGYAVAWGLIVELVLSHMRLGFPSLELQRLAHYIYENYGAFNISCDDYSELIRLMSHDKKNVSAEEINFTLLRNIGEVEIDHTASHDEIKTALDIYRDLFHL